MARRGVARRHDRPARARPGPRRSCSSPSSACRSSSSAAAGDGASSLPSSMALHLPRRHPPVVGPQPHDVRRPGVPRHRQRRACSRCRTATARTPAPFLGYWDINCLTADRPPATAEQRKLQRSTKVPGLAYLHRPGPARRLDPRRRRARQGAPLHRRPPDACPDRGAGAGRARVGRLPRRARK